jgi:hypothetical protein
MYWLVSNASDCDNSYSMAGVSYLYRTPFSAWFTVSFAPLEGYPFYSSLNFITAPSILAVHLFLATPPHSQGVMSHHKPIVPSHIYILFVLVSLLIKTGALGQVETHITGGQAKPHQLHPCIFRCRQDLGISCVSRFASPAPR